MMSFAFFRRRAALAAALFGMAAGGAFAAGPAWAIDYLIQRARSFIFSTAPPPAMAAALDSALDIVGGEPERRARLQENAAVLRRRLGELGFSIPSGRSQIIPVMIGDNELAVAMARALMDEGFDVRAIRPPSVPPGTARLRISVNAALDHVTLERFAGTLASTVARLTPCSVASS